jgi:hypothetical protein
MASIDLGTGQTFNGSLELASILASKLGIEIVKIWQWKSTKRTRRHYMSGAGRMAGPVANGGK